jgi:hypothetical protein
VFRSLENEQLIKAQSQQIAGRMVEMTGTEVANPKIQQRQVTQNPVEKFGDKCPIRGVEFARPQAFAQNGVGESSSVPPLVRGRRQRLCAN